MRIGITIGFLAVLLIGSSTDVKDPSDDFYQNVLTRDLNKARRQSASNTNINNMHELVFDPKLCKNHTFSSDSRGIIFLNQFVDFVEQTNIFLEKETQMLDARIYFGVEYIIPAQKKVCCEQLNVTTIQCGFGPEGELDSWTNRQTDKPPGSKCDPCYENYKGLCRKESKKPIPLSTTIIDPNPERDAPHFYNKTLPSAFNDIRRITAIYERIPNMYELVYDPELCPDLNGGGLEKNLRFTYFKMSKFDCEFLLNDTETFLIKIKEKQVNIQEIKTSQAVVGFEYIIPGQKKVCCEENNSDVVCVFGPEGGFDSWINKTCGTPGSCGEGYKNNTGLCAPNSSSSDPSSFPNNSSIIHGTESSEVTRIPLVYLRPTENPDLEKRLKKYLAEETDGDEPSEEKDEEYYYDYDSATSISILVTVVFVCFLVLFYE
uniref:Peptidase M12A domain-containing protein n=1 Tax=Caenorhabditis tropicalis TaxID=1561998 RepID=A0A1I7T1I2_9PELO